tara:strand:- start:474 stop:680 length:207 start_codon:yes stop_codon:yes gene_type:complete
LLKDFFISLFLKDENVVKMKKKFFKTLAKINKAVLPSLTKKEVDLAKASKLQMALFAYKLWVTKNSLD